MEMHKFLVELFLLFIWNIQSQYYRDIGNENSRLKVNKNKTKELINPNKTHWSAILLWDVSLKTYRYLKSSELATVPTLRTPILLWDTYMVCSKESRHRKEKATENWTALGEGYWNHPLYYEFEKTMHETTINNIILELCGANFIILGIVSDIVTKNRELRSEMKIS